MSEQDALDMFEELPRTVQRAVLSHLHSLRSRYAITFTDFNRDVVLYIAASNLLTVTFGDFSVRFQANSNTAVLRAHLPRLLTLVLTPPQVVA